MNLYYFAGWLLTGLYAYGWHRTRYYGRATLPKKGAFLIVSNHQSFADPNLVAFGLYRGIGFMARSTLFKGFLGWWLPRVYCFPIERGSSDRASLRAAVDILKSGRSLIVFPEGTRSLDGKIQGFKRGFALIARQADVPILPAAIHGAGRALPKGARLPKPYKIRVTYGAPVSPEELKVLGPEGIRERIQALMDGMDERFGPAPIQSRVRPQGSSGAGSVGAREAPDAEKD